MNVPDLLQQIKVFYLLEELYDAVSKAPTEKFIGISILREKVREKRDEMHAEFAKELWDYLAIICIGEGRHGIDQCVERFTMNLDKKSIFGVKRMRRKECYARTRELAHKLNPQLTLCQLLPTFILRRWHSGYGGKKWAEITKTALLFHETPHSVFIDTVINLEHNTGSCLNKAEAGVFTYCGKLRLIQFLALRASREFSFFSNQPEIYPGEDITVPHSILNLAYSAMNFGLIPQNFSMPVHTEMESERIVHTPIVWGKRTPMLVEKTDKEVRIIEQANHQAMS